MTKNYNLSPWLERGGIVESRVIDISLITSHIDIKNSDMNFYTIFYKHLPTLNEMHQDKLDKLLLEHDSSGKIKFKGMNNQAYQYPNKRDLYCEAKPFIKPLNPINDDVDKVNVIKLSIDILKSRGYTPNLIILSLSDYREIEKDPYNFNLLKSHTIGLSISPTKAQKKGVFTVLDNRHLSLQYKQNLISINLKLIQNNKDKLRLEVRQELAFLVHDNGSIISNTFQYFTESLVINRSKHN